MQNNSNLQIKTSVFILIIFSVLTVSITFAESVTYTYDTLNRLSSATYGTTIINYFYDANGNVTQMITPTGCTDIYYIDADEDGFGDPGNSIQSCSLPVGFVSDNTDCNDDTATGYYEHPGQTWYPDTDGDGYYYGSVNSTSCTRPAGYFAAEELITVSVQDNAPLVSNPDQNDSDNDGIGDAEDAFPTNPAYSTDTDGDGIADEWELSNFYNLITADAVSDSDLDTLTDLQEFKINSDPNVSISQKWDVNGDGKIGLEEAIHALQTVTQ